MISITCVSHSCHTLLAHISDAGSNILAQSYKDCCEGVLACNGGSTPLHIAAMKEHVNLEIVYSILEAFALSSIKTGNDDEGPPDPRSIADIYSNTPLHIARRNSKSKENLILKLLDSSSAPLTKDSDLVNMRKWMEVEREVAGGGEGGGKGGNDGPHGVDIEPMMTRTNGQPIVDTKGEEIKQGHESSRDVNERSHERAERGERHDGSDESDRHAQGSIEEDEEEEEEEDREGGSVGFKRPRRRRVRSECSVNCYPAHPIKLNNNDNTDDQPDPSSTWMRGDDDDDGSSTGSNQVDMEEGEVGLKEESLAGSTNIQQTQGASSTSGRASRIPSCFVCPLTKRLMRDPVLVVQDGVTYEREAIVERLQNVDTTIQFVPNLNLKEAIDLWTSSQRIKLRGHQREE